MNQMLQVALILSGWTALLIAFVMLMGRKYWMESTVPVVRCDTDGIMAEVNFKPSSDLKLTARLVSMLWYVACFGFQTMTYLCDVKILQVAPAFAAELMILMLGFFFAPTLFYHAADWTWKRRKKQLEPKEFVGHLKIFTMNAEGKMTRSYDFAEYEKMIRELDGDIQCLAQESLRDGHLMEEKTEQTKNLVREHIRRHPRAPTSEAEREEDYLALITADMAIQNQVVELMDHMTKCVEQSRGTEELMKSHCAVLATVSAKWFDGARMVTSDSVWEIVLKALEAMPVAPVQSLQD